MAKRGGSKHYVRLTLPRNLPLSNRKGDRWLLAPMPGRHRKNQSVSAGVLLRDVLGIAMDLKEAKRIVRDRELSVDGKPIKDIRAAIGIMDIVAIPKKNRAWRMQIMPSGKIAPKEIKAPEGKLKLCKVIGKRSVTGGKTEITMHDGRALLADNNVKVGATLRMALPEFKMKDMLPLQAGAKCLVTEGAHAGQIAVLEKIISRTGSMDSEAVLKSGDGQFVTVTKYLFVVDGEFA